MLAAMRARAGWAACRLVAIVVPLLALLGHHASLAQAQVTGGPAPSPPRAQVYFVNLQDGATVATKFSIVFALDRTGAAPAGPDPEDTDYLHLLIDTDLPPLDQPIPNDFNHLHFGAGQTEATVTLRPGEHTLQLLLGDKDHIPHDPPVTSARIKVHVVSETPPAPPPPSARRLTPSPPGAEVYFVDLQDGATVQRTFTVHFGLRNMGIAQAGSDRENSGHHHLLIDTELPPLDQPIPDDSNHLHFGAGQTETTLTLAPGEHTLQLLFGDGDHVPHGPPVMSARIHVRVVDDVVAAPKPGSSPAPAPGPEPPAAPDPAARPPSSSQRPKPSPGVARAYPRKQSPRGASVRFVGRRNGDRISTTVTLRFGAENVDIRPVGRPTRDSGHYQLLIDRNLPPLDRPMPVDSNHLDFPDGETLAKITLTPGEHTLQLLLVDDNNMAHDPPVFSSPLLVIVADSGNRDDRKLNRPSRLDPSGPSEDDPSPNGNGRYQDRRYRSGPHRYNRPRFRDD